MRKLPIIILVSLTALTPLMLGQGCANPARGIPGIGGGAGSLVGVWRGTYNDSLVGPTQVDLVLEPSGKFTETYTSATTFTYISGDYFVDLGQQGLLRLSVLDWYPKDHLGAPILPISGESWLYSFVDNNNLVLTNANCQNLNQPGCVINHQRLN
jgi:hypothetical protein